MQQSFKYFRPKTRAEAFELLADPTTRALPLVVRPKPLDPRRAGADAFVDLSLLDLDYIHVSADGDVRIGALTTLQAMVDSPVLRRGALSLLGQAAELVATPGIRSLASLWGAVQDSDGPPELILALLALDAELILMSAGERQRQISLQEFVALKGQAALPGEVLVEAALAPFDGRCGWALERVSRTPRDEAIVAAIAFVDITAGSVSRIRLALSGANPRPVRLTQVEEMLAGATYDEQIFHTAAEATIAQAQPVADFRGSADYRRAMAGLVVQRALRWAWQSALDRQTEN